MLQVGIVGSGFISRAYLRAAEDFPNVRITACSDVNFAAAEEKAREFRIQAQSVEELLGNSEVDLILNLTVPQSHGSISLRAIEAGKHVYSEKPLALSIKEAAQLRSAAEAADKRVGVAPDTFLGGGQQTARSLIDSGAIGTPIGGTAFILLPGHEIWHPNPDFYYQPGGGPVFDMGPYYLTMLVNLLGPVARVMAMATRGQEERLITAEGPFKNTSFKVGTPTNVLSLLEFRSGATVTFGASWDVFKHSNHPIELHGTEGSLRLPDPDWFGGTVSISRRGAN